jgi:hypothetical protein
MQFRLRGGMFGDGIGISDESSDGSESGESSSEDEDYLVEEDWSEDESEEDERDDDDREVETAEKIEKRGFMGKDLKLEVDCYVPSAGFFVPDLMTFKTGNGWI